MKKYYSDFPEIRELQNCEINDEGEIWVKILTKRGVTMYYNCTYDWEDYHDLPIVLDTKSSALIYLACKNEIDSKPHVYISQKNKEIVQFLSEYNISKILFLRQLSIQHLCEDLFFVIISFLI